MPWTEEQISNFGLTWGLGAFILLMLFIVGELAFRSKAGKQGTLILFFVLALGVFGFLIKGVIKYFLSGS